MLDAYVPSAPPPLPDTMFPLLGEDGAPLRPVAGPTRGALSEVSRGPYPLAVFTSGFLVDVPEATASYCRRLCSWGVRGAGVQQEGRRGRGGGQRPGRRGERPDGGRPDRVGETDVPRAAGEGRGREDTADDADDDIVTAPWPREGCT